MYDPVSHENESKKLFDSRLIGIFIEKQECLYILSGHIYPSWLFSVTFLLVSTRKCNSTASEMRLIVIEIIGNTVYHTYWKNVSWIYVIKCPATFTFLHTACIIHNFYVCSDHSWLKYHFFFCDFGTDCVNIMTPKYFKTLK